MLNSQRVRVSEYGTNPNNPYGLSPDLKQPFKIYVKSSAPLSAFGTYGDYVINSATGDFYYKDFKGVWAVVYNFDTGGGGGGIQDIENLGDGGEIFKEIIGGTAFFRTIFGETGEIILAQDDEDINISIDPTYKPLTLSNVGNFPLQGGVGVGSASPSGVLGTAGGFNKGSLYIQINTPKNLIWICDDPATNSWSLYSDVLSLVNLGTGAHVVASFDSQGTAYFRGIKGASGQIAVSQTANDIDMSMDNNYKPLTLAKVDNVKNSYTGSPVPPSIAQDSTQGYQVGSVYTQIATFPAGAHVWVCSDATPGAAVWKDISASPTVLSYDYIQWRNETAYIQTITGGAQDWNAGPTVLTELSFPSTVWSTSFDGSRQVFTKGTTTSTKTYHMNFSIIGSDLLGPRTDQKHYTIYMIRKSDGLIYRQSTTLAQTPPTTLTNCWFSASQGFIFQETTLSPVSYYFRILGDAGHNYNTERWAISINEV